MCLRFSVLITKVYHSVYLIARLSVALGVAGALENISQMKLTTITRLKRDGVVGRPHKNTELSEEP